jgi:hypothetical protein
MMMTSTTNPTRFQSNLKHRVKGEYEFRNIRNKTHIITKEMMDYSAIKSYLKINHPHYFSFSSNSEKPRKTVIHHLSPDTPAEDISDSLEDLDFNIINVRQIMVAQTAPNRQTHMEPLPLFLFALPKKYKISKDI